jgi:lysyl-tRNA synthetase, class II
MTARARLLRGLAALATLLVGVATVASSLSPNAPAREHLLDTFVPTAAQTVAHVIGALGGALVISLSVGVLRGRRPPSRAAIVTLTVLALVQIAKGLDYEEALLGLGVALGLQRMLRAGRQERTSRVLMAALVGLVALSGAYATTLGVLLVSGHSAELGAAALRAAEAVVWAVPAVSHSGPVMLALHLLAAIAGGAAVVVLAALLAPGTARDGHSVAEHARAAALVAAHGDDSIAPFALRADKAFHFAHGGALAYRALRETVVVAGDPVGPPGTAGPILASFVELAATQHWDVVLLGAREEHVREYAALGLRAMQVGLEAVVDPRDFSLDVPSAKTVRKAVRRVGRHGWTTEVHIGLDAGSAAEIAEVEAAWRRTHRRLYGFAMAGDRLWGAPEDADDVYVVARNPAGEARAFQRYVRYRRGLSLDAMRRLDDEPNGIADALVARVLEHGREHGYPEVSLNFSAFGHLMAAETLERRSDRLARWALRRVHRRFQLERLARFAGKFGPAWRPRYLIYTSRTRLPLAALRVMQAEAYLPRRRRRSFQGAWLPAPSPRRPLHPMPR